MIEKNPHGALIEPKLKEIHARLSSFGIPENLYSIIHRPGWTTPAELYFVNYLIDEVQKTMNILQGQIDALHVGSAMIQ